MTPKEYLYRIALNFGGLSYDDIMMAVSDELVEKYSNDMKNGDKFPIIYYNRDNSSQEGRHRALSALKLNCKKLPVIEFVDITNPEFDNIIKRLKGYNFEELCDIFIKMGFKNGITMLGYNDLQRYIQYN